MPGVTVQTSAPWTPDGADDVEISPAELGEALSGEVDDEQARTAAWPDGGPQVAGVALVAADTGRVLMIQRALSDDDPAAGSWEFAGGHLEAGDATDLHGAMREWAEEIGHPVPTNAAHAHRWENGPYRGHVLVIPAESALDLAAPRTVHNPDDDAEQAAWWDPADARKNPALRRECRRTPWDKIIKAATDHAGEAKALPRTYLPSRRIGPDPWAATLAALAERKDAKPGAQRVANTGRPQGEAWASQTSTAPASVAKDKGGKKRKVASKAGEARYGLPIGTELGKARDRNAEGAQKDKGALDSYEQLRKTPPEKYREVLDKMAPDALRKLSQLLYSARSSDPAVVRARVAIAGALKRKGIDVNTAGGLGRVGKAPARKTPARKRSGKVGSTIKGNVVDANRIDDRTRDALLAEGWRGRPDDGREALYRPGTKGADMTTDQRRREAAALLGVDVGELNAALSEVKSGNPFARGKGKGDDEDDDGGNPFAKRDDEDDEDEPDDDSGDSDDEGDEDDEDDEPRKGKGNLAPPFGSEGKAATTSSASGKRKAKNAGKTIKDEDGDDAYPIRTVGDVAAALKKAKAIKDPARKKKVMGHIRSGAADINAGHMVPKSDDADKGTGKGKGSGGGPPEFIKKKIDKKSLDIEFADVADRAAAIEAKVMSPSPGATKLREYWAHGEGAKKWRPGSPGDFERLRRAVKQYVPAHMLNGFVANVHKLATGEWPGKRAHGAKSLDAAVITAAELKDATGDGDSGVGSDGTLGDGDAVTLALDSYADMADGITSGEEYEQALADQVQWDVEPDGSLSVSDVEPERGHGVASRDDGDTGDDGPYDPMGFLDELAETVGS